MKKGQEYTGTVGWIDFPNKGVVITEEGERVIVKNVITGQKVRVVVSKLRGGKAEGRLLEVIEKSELEVRTPACPHFGECGGCTYATISYDEQLKLKSEQVLRILNKVIPYEFEYMGIQGSPLEYGYRNKMEFSFGDDRKDGPLTLGLHKRGSFYDVLTVSGCRIVNEDYNKILTSVLEFCRRLGFSYYHKTSHEGYLRHLVVRRAATTGEILVNLVTTSQWNGIDEAATLEALKNRLLDLDLNGNIVGVLHTINDGLADDVKSDKTTVLHGKDFFFEEMLQLFFKISAFSFFQTNSFGAEILYKTVREFVGETKDKVIFDLYTGTGTIAQVLAPVARKVIGVEIVEEAVLSARENAMLNDLGNCEFIVGDVLKVVDELEEKPDIIVLDPPREGIHPKTLKKIINFDVERIVYISCKPTSLAHDLVVLQEAGYSVVKVKTIDMFPGTVHVETAVLLVRKG